MPNMTVASPSHTGKPSSKETEYLIDVFVPNHSRGLMVDAIILKTALGADKVRIITVPFRACQDTLNENDNNIHFEPLAEIAVFVERLFEHRKLQLYKRRVFLTNPEWMSTRDRDLAQREITEFWHKTRFGETLITNLFPKKIHHYVGFTSLRNPAEVRDYSSICHFRGRSTTRHTQDILDIWIKNPGFPQLTIQMYSDEVSIPKWIESDNLRLFMGFLGEQELQSEFIKHGIHICTSQMEGFGHYINEARSIGALIIAIDAPPMNELINESCGILIPPTQSFKHNCGVRFLSTIDEIKDGISRALKMSTYRRQELGEKSRDLFIEGQKDFILKLKSIALKSN
jgi:hypothetical protein